jgi:phosphosulfolactate synthase
MTTERTSHGPRFADALGILFPTRSTKPRTHGMTMVMDIGWPVGFVRDVLESFGEYLDVVKLWDTHLRVPEQVVRRKIDAYHAHDVLVQPGGIIFEIARAQDRGHEILRRFRDFGFDIVEISATASSEGRGLDQDAALANEARDLGMTVYGEVGTKFAETDATRRAPDELDVERTIEEFQGLLNAGASRVYWEGHLLRIVVGEDGETIRAHADTGCRQVLEVVQRVGEENIFFEVSALQPLLNRRALQFWLVRTFGPEVNIANARLEELPHLEALRSGHHPIFGFGQAGNYPWLRSLAAGGGQPSQTWWRDD